MTDDAYAEWGLYHLKLFGLIGFRGATDTIAEWERFFRRKGYTPSELREASEWLAEDPPPFLSGHLGAIQGRIRDCRRAAESIAQQVARRNEIEQRRLKAVPPPADWRTRTGGRTDGTLD